MGDYVSTKFRKINNGDLFDVISMDIINVIDEWFIGLDIYIIFKTIVARLKCLLSALLIMHKHEHSIPYLHFINNFIYQENKFNGVGISYIKSPYGFGPYTNLLKHNNKWIFQAPIFHVIHISHQFHSVYLRIKYSGFLWMHIDWTCCPGITGILYFDPCYLQSRSCHYIPPSFIHYLYLKQFSHRSIRMTDHVCYYLLLCSSYWSPHQ